MKQHFAEQLLLQGRIQRRVDPLGGGRQIIVHRCGAVGAGDHRVLSQADGLVHPLLHLDGGGVQQLLAALAQLPGSRIERTVDDKPSQHSHHQGEQQHQRPQPSLDGGGSQTGYDSLQWLFLP